MCTKPSASAGARVLRPCWWHQRWPYWWQRVAPAPGQRTIAGSVMMGGFLLCMYDPFFLFRKVWRSSFKKEIKSPGYDPKKYKICYIKISLAGFRRLARVRNLKKIQTDDFIDNSWPKRVAWTQALPSDWIKIWKLAERMRKTMHNALWFSCFSGLEGWRFEGKRERCSVHKVGKFWAIPMCWRRDSNERSISSTC